MKKYILIALYAFFNSIAYSLDIDISSISQKSSPPLYPYPNFFKTAGIGTILITADNQHLLFLQNSGKIADLFAYSIKTQQIKQLTHLKYPIADFVLGKKTNRIIFSQDKGGNEQYNLFYLPNHSAKAIQLTDVPDKEQAEICEFSNDDQVLYYSQSEHQRAERSLFKINLNTLKKERLLQIKRHSLYCGNLDESEQYLSFFDYIENNEVHIGLLNLKTKAFEFILKEPQIKNEASGFIGKTLYFLSTKGSDHSRIWSYQTETKQLQLLPLLATENIIGLAVFNEGKIAVSYRDKTFKPRIEIYYQGQKITSHYYPKSTDINAINFSRTDPDIGLMEISNATLPPVYFLLRKNQRHYLFDANASGIPESHFCQVRSTRIPSFDGLEIPTHLYIPNGTSKKNPKPVMMLIHGGPEYTLDPVYDAMIQFYCNRGLIVVAPNVRGSNGFGLKYSHLDDGDWGGGHIKDIVAVTKAIKSLSFVKQNQLIINGASFGGFSVLSLITQYPKLYQGAINRFGISEIKQFYQSWPSAIRPYWLKELGFDPEKNNQKNKAISPLYHFQQIETPLQIHQGSEDIRVPVKQAELAVAALKQAHKTVEYYLYLDEGHGFKQFKNNQKMAERILQFIFSIFKQIQVDESKNKPYDPPHFKGAP